MGDGVGGMVWGIVWVGIVWGCEGDDVGGMVGDGMGAMPWGMMMLGDGVGLGNGRMVWGAGGHRASSFSKMHTETSTDKSNPSLGYAVSPAPGAPCRECRALAGPGALSGGHHTMYVYKLQIVSN